MDTDEIYSYLNSSDKIGNKKKELREYLKSQVNHFLENQSDGERIANEIAGLLSTKFAFDLTNDDPYMEVLDIATGLELPLNQRSAGENWTNFMRKIEELK